MARPRTLTAVAPRRHLLRPVLLRHHAQHQPPQPQRARQAHGRALRHHESRHQRGRGPPRGAAAGEPPREAPQGAPRAPLKAADLGARAGSDAPEQRWGRDEGNTDRVRGTRGGDGGAATWGGQYHFLHPVYHSELMQCEVQMHNDGEMNLFCFS